jgi:hypothetical protein
MSIVSWWNFREPAILAQDRRLLESVHAFRGTGCAIERRVVVDAATLQARRVVLVRA